MVTREINQRFDYLTPNETHYNSYIFSLCLINFEDLKKRIEKSIFGTLCVIELAEIRVSGRFFMWNEYTIHDSNYWRSKYVLIEFQTEISKVVYTNSLSISFSRWERIEYHVEQNLSFKYLNRG